MARRGRDQAKTVRLTTDGCFGGHAMEFALGASAPPHATDVAGCDGVGTESQSAARSTLPPQDFDNHIAFSLQRG